MKLRTNLMTSAKFLSIAWAIAIPGLVFAQAESTPQAKEATANASTGPQKQFSTPKEAADALIAAAASFDVPALKEILGPSGEDLVSSQDPVMDKNRAIS